ncbi:hypothetical protein KFU94_71170 [Chloroflexi bacterium TSY]|nr:hypothetical protein [Chloroflexi bacterium TSY]MBV7340281.1 hypothetical protein [Chloroflexi bacterium TSY]
MTSAKSLLHTPTHIVQNTIYLPIVVTVPKVSPYLFRTDDSCTGDTFSEPVQSGSILASGFKRLKSNVLIQGGVGRQWSQTWSLNGQTQASLTKSGLITQENEVLNFTFWYGEDGNCGDNVPAGTWDVTFMLNGAVFQTGRVVIQ